MPFHMYVSLQDDDRISIFTGDSSTGKLRLQEEVDVIGGPAPLAITPDRKFLYVGGQRGKSQ